MNIIVELHYSFAFALGVFYLFWRRSAVVFGACLFLFSLSVDLFIDVPWCFARLVVGFEYIVFLIIIMLLLLILFFTNKSDLKLRSKSDMVFLASVWCFAFLLLHWSSNAPLLLGVFGAIYPVVFVFFYSGPRRYD